jgi:hypothetical protein
MINISCLCLGAFVAILSGLSELGLGYFFLSSHESNITLKIAVSTKPSGPVESVCLFL